MKLRENTLKVAPAPKSSFSIGDENTEGKCNKYIQTYIYVEEIAYFQENAKSKFFTVQYTENFSLSENAYFH